MNHSFSEIRKAAMATLVSALALAGYFIADLDTGTSEDIVAVAAALLNVVGVYMARNEPAPVERVGR